MDYVTTVGLEVHAELNTKSKMFCGCKNEPHGSVPNSLICPVCLAQPGTLPVPNEEAIKMVLMFGQAVSSEVSTFSEFDRKNYFYPDIPKAYQISQYAYPFLTGGELAGVQLTRVHLEEDTARSQHDKGDDSLVDFNRAGVPLMELVTEPVIHDSKTAGNFARELQLLLRTLNISNANMEKGEMRVEANISVSKNDKSLGTKVEVKNLNSFKSVESAIDYEVARQKELLDRGEEIKQETRGWDEVKLKTFSQRSKETAKDYRYFPDPDLPKLQVGDYKGFSKSSLDEIMPTLPNEKRLFYKNLGLPSNSLELLVADISLSQYYDQYVALVESDKEMAVLGANYLLSDVVFNIGEGKQLDDLSVEHFVELMQLLSTKQIGSRVAKDLLVELFGSKETPLSLAQKGDLLQVSDKESLAPVIDKIIAENASIVAEYKSGKEASLKYLLGQGMKETKGSADPKMLETLLIKAMK